MSFGTVILLKECEMIFIIMIIYVFSDIQDAPHFIRWTDDGKIKHGTPIDVEGKPFMVMGSRLMECHQGTDHHKKKSEVYLTTKWFSIDLVKKEHEI